MLLGNTIRSRGLRLLLPVARDMMAACCPRYFRSALAEEDLDILVFEIVDDGDSEETAQRCQLDVIVVLFLQLRLLAHFFLPCRLKARFEGLGMSNSLSTVLGVSVQAGQVDSKKIDGATGKCQFKFNQSVIGCSI